ncbi:hypothetical protein Y032_0049g1879 [Ancylostoma ceylanicum]|uniref:Enoyl-CoA hydratase/isomerase family protein n=1 Tax=Ancylostoma ceylanicum TaxID=53326 RepID=A0A016UBI6_9BILA|nr:hypothetical protein Y032_0049g1879 [Ancylostoma ceylanicum]
MYDLDRPYAQATSHFTPGNHDAYYCSSVIVLYSYDMLGRQLTEGRLFLITSFPHDHLSSVETMLVLRRSLSTASSLLGRELYQGESVVRLILKDVKRRNALSLEMIEALTKEMEGINTIPKIRSVIISSEGPAFSSGHDLRELVRFTTSFSRQYYSISFLESRSRVRPSSKSF